MSAEEGTRRVNISEAQAHRMMEQQQRAQQQDEQKESMIAALVTVEGRERLKRIEQVKPERAAAVERQIIANCQAGRMQPPVGDDLVREMLVQASTAEGGGGAAATSITFVRKSSVDDDW